MGRHGSDLPPKLRNWKRGTPQVGAFLRTRMGSTVVLVNDKATEEQETLVLALILGPRKMPADLMGGLRAWVNAQVNREET